MGAQLMAIVAEGDRARIYLPPTPEHEAAAQVRAPTDVPDGEHQIIRATSRRPTTE